MSGRKVVRGGGINTIEVNAAREIHMRTVRARIPTSAAADKTSQRDFKTPASPLKTPARHVCNNPNNPPCSHCGTMIVPSPSASLPLEDFPSMTINDWTISTKKRPILNSQELEHWEKHELRGLTLPEMIFGNSFVRIENTRYGWTLQFNALDALKLVNLADSGIRVSYSKKWMDSKQKKQSQKSSSPSEFEMDDSSLQIAHHYDWTYTTRYKGTERCQNEKYRLKRDDTQSLPLDKLARPDHILFYDDMILFEDELADNGISILNVKIRVMNERLLLLSRFFLRVDNVLARVMDTRVCVEFDENKVMREFKEMEGDYKSLLARHRLSHSHDPKAALRDANWVAQNLPQIRREFETLIFD
ncbi:hypothetical protein HG536_0B04020 [Torulaspora globosa]|uniref:Type 2A phosphatase activator TIP41 n=1 Tax=Torulaspora globosa TaxID=48254 RepID=A0A7G3ZDF2_9SACH|nr:uncharacterized protein HG536_0B04020 [Torulaspora globosa]QLL31538.1 hypothetical protein HG536_0B04020 [Torulaspora globosa]